MHLQTKSTFQIPRNCNSNNSINFQSNIHPSKNFQTDCKKQSLQPQFLAKSMKSNDLEMKTN